MISLYSNVKQQDFADVVSVLNVIAEGLVIFWNEGIFMLILNKMYCI